MTISVISSCMDRVDALNISINSWSLFEEIDEIVFVDWSSNKCSKFLTNVHKKIKRIYVPEQKYFYKTQALNLAFSLTKGDKILHLDSDTILNPYSNFFNQHHLDDRSFFTGMIRHSSNPFTFPLWGLLYLTKENYKKVGGYNETMGRFVAWEDDEIVNRLILSGLLPRKINLDNNSIFSIPHDDLIRIKNFEAYNLVDKNFHNNSPEEILLRHTLLNKKKYKRNKNDSFYIAPSVKWNVQQISDQNYIAHKISQ